MGHSQSTRHGWWPPWSRSICWPLLRLCSCTTPRSPGPSRRRCATGCCTSQPGSPADNVGSGYASTDTGPGPSASLPLSPVSARCPRRPDDRQARHDERREPPAEQQAGYLAMPAHTEHRPQRSNTASKDQPADPWITRA